MSFTSKNWVTPFLVTRNSAPWIAPLLHIYQIAGLEPHVILDSRSSDGTQEVLERNGFAYRVASCEVDRAEPMVAEILHDHPEGWLIRMDDDEVPSVRLLDYLCGPEPPSDGRVIGFARRFYQRDATGQLYRGRWTPRAGLHMDLRYDWQYRLFRAESVVFTGEIHTPGFIVPEYRTRCPSDAFIGHFVWLLRTLEQRRTKIIEYDRQKQFAGSFFRAMYVPEDAGPREVVMVRCRTTEFDAIAAVMASASGHGER